jgi:hypothetical protein
MPDGHVDQQKSFDTPRDAALISRGVAGRVLYRLMGAVGTITVIESVQKERVKIAGNVHL